MSSSRGPAAVAAAERLRAERDAARTRVAERQTWERRVDGTDVAEAAIHLEVDAEGRVRLHEALVARLLHEAGWERTA